MMIDYTYTELTSSCVQALTQFQRIHPEHRPQEVGNGAPSSSACMPAEQAFICVCAGACCLLDRQLSFQSPLLPPFHFSSPPCFLPCLHAQVSRAIAAGVQYIREQQREDGSWYGSWAVCFTYGWVSCVCAAVVT